LTQTDWGPGKFPVGVNPMEVERFNPANFGGGQLTRVDLKLDYRFENTLSIQFFNITTITVNATGKIDLFMPDGTTKAVPSGTFLNTASMTSNPSTMLMKFVVPQPPTTGSSSATYTDAATLAQFTGTTKIGFPAVASATSDFRSLSGNGFGSSLTFASAQITIVYHYVVPEPSSSAPRRRRATPPSSPS